LGGLGEAGEGCGRGFGLYIVKSLVGLREGGVISAVSRSSKWEVGEGKNFFFSCTQEPEVFMVAGGKKFSLGGK